MKKIIGIGFIFLCGCSTPWVYTPAPTETISMQTSSMASGVLQPQNFYFTLISQYDPDSAQARVVILTEPALKLADLTVSKDQIQVHERMARVPNRLIRAWGELVREQFLTSCPERKIIYQSAAVRGEFELEVTGGICL